MRAVNTNLLVRLLVRDNAPQARAEEVFIEGGAWISHLVLAETPWVVDAVYQRKSAQIAAAIKLLLIHDKLIIQDADVVSSALDVFRVRPPLGFSDCLVLQIARKAGHLPLGTFDKALAKIDGAQGL